MSGELFLERAFDRFRDVGVTGETQANDTMCGNVPPQERKAGANGAVILPPQKSEQGLTKGGDLEFVMFEDVDGMEVFVNPEHVIWVREYPGEITVISCGHEDKFAVRLSPAQAVAALGRPVR